MTGETTIPPPPYEFENMALIDLLLKYSEAHGVSKLIIMAQIRSYCNQSSTLSLLEEIKGVWDESHLNALIGVGMKGVLYYQVLSQKAQLAGL